MQVTLLKSSESQEKSINRFLMPSKSLFYYYSEDYIMIIILIIIFFLTFIILCLSSTPS